MEHKILVIYIGVAGVRSEDIKTYIDKLTKKILPSTFEGEIIIIPQQSLDIRIECINPKYITDENLIKEHTDMIKKLSQELNNQSEIIKENNL